MKWQKIFSFFVYYIIFGVCSINAQENSTVSNVSFVRQNLLKKAETYFRLPFVKEYDVFVFSASPDSNSALVNFWQGIMIEKALAAGKKVYKSTNIDSLPGKFLTISSRLFGWKIKIKKAGRHGFVQQFCCNFHIHFFSQSGRILLNSTKEDCFQRTIKNREILDAVQSSEPGFQHIPPKMEYGFLDFLQTAVIAGATLSSVLLLYSFRSQ